MPPMRGHDLKQNADHAIGQFHRDAPHTGARLETKQKQDKQGGGWDAPHTGARLETVRLPQI